MDDNEGIYDVLDVECLFNGRYSTDIKQWDCSGNNFYDIIFSFRNVKFFFWVSIKDWFDRDNNPSHLTLYPDVLKIKTIIVVNFIFFCFTTIIVFIFKTMSNVTDCNYGQRNLCSWSFVRSMAFYSLSFFVFRLFTKAQSTQFKIGLWIQKIWNWINLSAPMWSRIYSTRHSSKFFLIWTSRQTKNLHSPKTISYLDQFFRFAPPW